MKAVGGWVGGGTGGVGVRACKKNMSTFALDRTRATVAFHVRLLQAYEAL